MKYRAVGPFTLLLAIACGCEPVAAPPAPLSEEELRDLPEEEGEENEEQDTPNDASVSRSRLDASVILTRDAAPDASDALDSSADRDAGADSGSPSDASSPGSDAAVHWRDAGNASDAATEMDAALAAREAGAPIVVAPAPVGIPAVDGPVEWIVDRCRNLSPDRVYFRAQIQQVELGAIYDFDALSQPCQTETSVRPVIAGTGTVLIANVNDANIGVATSGIRAPEGHYTNALTTWNYTWIDASNSGHQLRLPLTQQLCPLPRLFAVPNTSRFFVDCGNKVYDEEGHSFSIGDGSILAVGRDGLILAYFPSTAGQPAKLAYYMRGTSSARIFDLESGLVVKAARSNGTGFLLVLGSPILLEPPVPDRLYSMAADGTRELRGAYPDYGDTYLSFIGSGSYAEAALDANGVLYDLRSRTYPDFGPRGTVVRRTVGTQAAVEVYIDPFLPEQLDLMPYRLHGLVTGP